MQGLGVNTLVYTGYSAHSCAPNLSWAHDPFPDITLPFLRFSKEVILVYHGLLLGTPEDEQPELDINF